MSYYTGLKLSGGRETFLYKGYVSEKTHGHRYSAVIGPFYSKFAADLMSLYGRNNIHLPSVHAAQEWAKRLSMQGIRSVPQYLRWLETNAIREIR